MRRASGISPVKRRLNRSRSHANRAANARALQRLVAQFRVSRLFTGEIPLARLIRHHQVDLLFAIAAAEHEVVSALRRIAVGESSGHPILPGSGHGSARTIRPIGEIGCSLMLLPFTVRTIAKRRISSDKAVLSFSCHHGLITSLWFM